MEVVMVPGAGAGACAGNEVVTTTTTLMVVTMETMSMMDLSLSV
jgi:hypothetical protein